LPFAFTLNGFGGSCYMERPLHPKSSYNSKILMASSPLEPKASILFHFAPFDEYCSDKDF